MDFLGKTEPGADSLGKMEPGAVGRSIFLDFLVRTPRGVENYLAIGVEAIPVGVLSQASDNSQLPVGFSQESQENVRNFGWCASRWIAVSGTKGVGKGPFGAFGTGNGIPEGTGAIRTGFGTQNGRRTAETAKNLPKPSQNRRFLYELGHPGHLS